MASTCKLFKVLIKNNTVKLSRIPQKADKQHAFFPPTFKIEEVESQRSPIHPMLSFPPVIKKLIILYR